MRVEVHDQLQNPVAVTGSRVVVYDEFDNPLALVIRVKDNHYFAATAGHKSFEKLLKMVGIDKTLVVDRIDATKLKPLL